MTPQPKSGPRQPSSSPTRPVYEALRGGNYREGGERAEAGETYSDIPPGIVEDLTSRRAIKLVSGSDQPNGHEGAVNDDA